MFCHSLIIAVCLSLSGFHQGRVSVRGSLIFFKVFEVGYRRNPRRGSGSTTPQAHLMFTKQPLLSPPDVLIIFPEVALLPVHPLPSLEPIHLHKVAFHVMS